MKLPASNKTASFGRKPYVKKGYYPAQLLAVKPYEDKDHKLIEGTYGHQIIFEFAIFDKDENDKPTKPMMFKEEGRDDVPVKIPKFVYHEYKNKNKTAENPDDFQTAITPKSAITRALQALGWVFTEDGVDMESLLGKWVEVNVNDYKTKTNDGEVYTSSSINEVGVYANDNNEGEIPAGLQAVPASRKPESVSKQIKHEEVKSEETAPEVKEEKVVEEKVTDGETEEGLEAQIKTLDQLHKEGNLTEEGHKQSVEQLRAKIEALK